jgi:ribonuclease R
VFRPAGKTPIRNESMKKASKLANRAIAHLRTQKTKSISVEALQDALGIEGNAKKGLQKSLSLLMKSGELVRDDKGSYGLSRADDLVYGKLIVLPSGNGFVENVFIRENEMGTALPGDEVLLQLNTAHVDPATPSRGPSGRVARLVKRARHDIVGTLQTTGRFYYVVPIGVGYAHDFYVSDPCGAKINDRVLLRFTGWENRHVNPEGEIIEVIGPADDPSADTLSVIKHYGLPESFAAAVTQEAEAVSAFVEEPGEREDLREKFVFTIDPVTARDFDDALSLEILPSGQRCLGVHIADVSHFIKPNKELDKEALNRGNSVYLPDKVIPMLPEQLSNGVCSLRPNEDRLTFSAFITFDADGEVVESRFAKTLIHSKLRLTYEQAMATLDGRTDDESSDMTEASRALVHDFDELAQQMRQRRFGRFALELDVPESEIRIGEDGMITDVVAVVNDRSHQLIEECMVAANQAVAKFLSEKNLPVISRLHEPPKEEKISELAAKLDEMGYKPGNLNQTRNLAKFLKSIVGHPMESQIKIMVLKSLQRAIYSADKHGHYGLAKVHYAHFTSPIRRYPDLTVHRQLEVAIRYSGAAREKAYGKPELTSVAEHCSKTELTADEASRTLLEMKKYRYLEQIIEMQSPKDFEAVVVTVVRFGLFVELKGLQIQGLVHASQLSSGRAHYQHPGELRAGKTVFRQGTIMQVSPVSVNFDKRQIDFAPVK